MTSKNTSALNYHLNIESCMPQTIHSNALQAIESTKGFASKDFHKGFNITNCTSKMKQSYTLFPIHHMLSHNLKHKIHSNNKPRLCINATSHASCLGPPNKPNNVIIKPMHLHYSIKNHTLIPYTYFHS